MSTPRARHSKKDSRATFGRHGVVRPTAAKVLTGHDSTKHAASAPGVATPTPAELDRLMGQMREANERLVVAAVQAQNMSDEARTEAAQARVELERLMSQLEDANERLGAAAAEAQAMAEEAVEREEEYRQLSGRLLTLQDDERRRLALDLHDSTAQNLVVLSMNLTLLERDDPALSAESRRMLAESRSLADECSRDVRMQAYLLHPPLLDEAGLVPAVRWFAEGFTSRSGIRVVMTLAEVGRLPRPIETALFRVVQESLTNVHRHASTRTVSIRLAASGDEVTLEIRDRGRGLSVNRSQQHGRFAPRTLGVGIQGMRERISQLAGTFDIEFTARGTIVRVRVPLNRTTT
jgi:signal transduction histidine kinase